MKNIFVLIVLAFQLLNTSGAAPFIGKDTLHPVVKWHETDAFRISVAPVILIGYGLATMKESKVVIGDREVHELRQEYFSGFKTDADNYMPSASLVVMFGLDAAGVKSRNHWISQTALFIAANALNGLATKKVKHLSGITRPDGLDRLSFPSGHTSSAFVAAEMLHQEFKDQDPWISITGYSLATAVGALRILNNRHWLSDVAAGAGFGILSVRLTYFTYNHTLKRWGDKLKKKDKKIPAL